MYGELVDMWNMVFCKDSSSRPSASDLLSMRWMRKMEHGNEQCTLYACTCNLWQYIHNLFSFADGERILRELVGDKDLDILSG